MSEWQPIEAPPKDGTFVDVGWLQGGVLEYQTTSCWRGGYWVALEGGFYTPTHWRPRRTQP